MEGNVALGSGAHSLPRYQPVTWVPATPGTLMGDLSPQTPGSLWLQVVAVVRCG